MEYIKQLRQTLGSSKIIVNCAAVWIENQNGILLERRGDDGNWGIIGGVMELGESSSECAAREVEEETGQACQIHHLIGIYSKYEHTYPNGDQVQPIVHFFKAEIDSNAQLVPSHESIELRYFDPEEIPTLGMPQHRDMLADALANRKAVLR